MWTVKFKLQCSLTCLCLTWLRKDDWLDLKLSRAVVERGNASWTAAVT